MKASKQRDQTVDRSFDAQFAGNQAILPSFAKLQAENWTQRRTSIGRHTKIVRLQFWEFRMNQAKARASAKARTSQLINTNQARAIRNQARAIQQKEVRRDKP